jgi:hypothetical protein
LVRVEDMSEDVLLRDKKIQLSVAFDVVSISVHCADEYTAQVLFDDMVERCNKDGGISIQIGNAVRMSGLKPL